MFIERIYSLRLSREVIAVLQIRAIHFPEYLHLFYKNEIT